MPAKAEFALSRVGFDAVKEAERIIKIAKDNPEIALSEVGENLAGFEREQLRGELATYYPYYILNFQGERRIFSAPTPHPDFLVQNQIDPQERGGAVLEGWERFEKELVTIEGEPTKDSTPKVFLWISPRGKAGAEGDYQNITFPHHQIYLGTATESEIETWALKCDVEEKFLKMWLESLSSDHRPIDESSPRSFLTSPLISSSIESPRMILAKLKEVLNDNDEEDTFHIYEEKGVRGKIRVEEVLQRMEEAKKSRESDTVKKLIGDLTADFSGGRISKAQVEDKLAHTYFSLMRQYQDTQGNVQLKGCGGTINLNLNEFGLKTTFSLGSLNPFASTFSTEFRTSKTSGEKKLKCECPFCHKKIVAVIEDGRIHCPECKKSAEYKC